MAALAASIKELGVLQPVLVREVAPESFELIAGERRWRAARRAGLQTIPALIQSSNDASSLEQALVENLHREDLNPLEEAAAYQQLLEEFGLTHEQLSQRVGKSRAAVTNSLRLFQLPPSVQRHVQTGSLSAGHARALLGTPDREEQERLAQLVVDEGLSVRAIEAEVRALTADSESEAAEEGDAGDPQPEGDPGQPEPAPLRRRTLRPPGVLELEELLADHLNTRVRVDMGAKRGKVVVDFATLEDLERIYRLMIGGASQS